MYAQLAALQVGDQVPAEVYVADYADGRRPTWMVEGREELGDCGVRLLLTDPANGDMFDRPAVIVLTFPAKTLRTPVQLHGVTGPAVISNKLCDMAQQGRVAARRNKSDVADDSDDEAL